MSFLLNIGDVHVQSLWNNDHVAKHVNDVSKSHHQMHMHPNVHEREESTKECIAKNTNRAFLYLKDFPSFCHKFAYNKGHLLQNGIFSQLLSPDY